MSVVGGNGKTIVGSNIISHHGDGFVISPYEILTQQKTRNTKLTHLFATNDEILEDNNITNYDAPITTYLLGGGGFNLPTIAVVAY